MDLDGTLLDTTHTPMYGDQASLARLQPIHATVQRARALRRLGYKLIVITGRVEAVRAVTELQVAVLLGPEVPVHMQTTWQGGRTVATYKAHALTEVGATLYVGDSLSDQHAAHLAHVPYASAAEFGAGKPIPVFSRTMATEGR